VANQHAKVNMEPNGYFQLFNPKGHRRAWPLAGACFRGFLLGGRRRHLVLPAMAGRQARRVPELAVDHFPSKSIGENWNGIGQIDPAGKWRQLGILTTRGFSTFLQMTQLPDTIKLTDTLYGQSKVIPTADVNDFVKIVPTGLEFSASRSAKATSTWPIRRRRGTSTHYQLLPFTMGGLRAATQRRGVCPRRKDVIGAPDARQRIAGVKPGRVME
jgi:hypothetical protein